jgi:hypothetical protein
MHWVGSIAVVGLDHDTLHLLYSLHLLERSGGIEKELAQCAIVTQLVPGATDLASTIVMKGSPERVEVYLLA